MSAMRANYVNDQSTFCLDSIFQRLHTNHSLTGREAEATYDCNLYKYRKARIFFTVRTMSKYV